MHGIGVAVEQPDREAVHPKALDRLEEGTERGLVERAPHRAVGIDALRHAQAAFPRHQEIRLVEEYVVLVVAPFVGDLEDVPESFGRDHAERGSLALDDRVGGERGSVDDGPDVGRLQSGAPECGGHRVPHPAHGVVGSRRQLRAHVRLPHRDRDIGEGAPDVDAHAVARPRTTGSHLSPSLSDALGLRSARRSLSRAPSRRHGNAPRSGYALRRSRR